MTVIAATIGEATEQGHSLWASMMFDQDTTLGGRSGVIGSGLGIVKTSGMGFAITPGRAGIQHDSIAAGGLVPFAVTANEVGSFTNGDAVKDRIDLVYATISAGTVAIVTVPGAIPSSGSPIAPALPADSIALFYVLVEAGTSAGSGGWETANVTDARKYLGEGRPGDVSFSFSNTVPPGKLRPSGQAVSRTVYADLFAAIGVTYGAGDGSTTFTLPDFRERTPVGLSTGSAEFGTLGQKFGAKTHTLTIAQMPSHDHPQVVTSGPGGTAARNDYTSEGPGGRFDQGVNTNPTGGGGAHNNIQPSMAVSVFIRY